MSKLVKVWIYILSAAVLLPTLFSGSRSISSAEHYSMNFLVAGMDDAAENTDVLSVININSSDKRLNYIQIPRDTYCNLDVYHNKINHVYSTARASGMTANEAMERLASFIESALSVNLDGYVAIGQSTFEELIDGIGGVYVTLDDEISVQSKSGQKKMLKKGENLLTSDEALFLVRHRQGYVRGDLDRLDVQKNFFQGLINTMLSRTSRGKLLAVARRLSDKAITNLSIFDILKLISSRDALSKASISAYTLYGEALKSSDGIWYYVLNKMSNDRLVKEIFGSNGHTFDSDNNFLKQDDSKFKYIYFKNGL